jgi:polyhydroxyalkanoate synthesis regulator phasin
MNEALQRYLDAASGVTNLTKSKAEQLAKQLVKSGEAASDQVGELVDQLMERRRKNQDAVSAMVKSETSRAVRAMGLATRSEVERLQKQVADLKREVATMDRGSGAGPAKKAAKKSPAKKTAKKAAKKSAKKTAKKSAKKAAKKSPAKKTAKKASGS